MLKTIRNLAQFAKQVPFEKWNIVKGDKVVITSGKEQGKSGTVLRVYRQSNEVLVQ
jgi:large subunit ribosomal protein L24